MLRNFQHQTVAGVLRLQRIENCRQVTFELDVDDGADDLRDASGLIGLCGNKTLSFEFLKTAASGC
jgi:hypothetical protein